MFRWPVFLILVIAGGYQQCAYPSSESALLNKLSILLSSHDNTTILRELASLQHEARQLTYQCSECPFDWYVLGRIEHEIARKSGGLAQLKAARLAKNALTRAARLDIRVAQGDALANLAQLYLETPSWPLSFGDKHKARQLLEEALVIAPQNISVLLVAGQLYLELGQTDKARRYLQMVVDTEPMNNALTHHLKITQASTMLTKINNKLLEQ
ncbi:tetratricopeptide repeat protein [Bowmanella denitrificans]|uniref:tetratricopeptide repeat protein n=1 Tax=Bowmanella denitrificans TaxID=366582 RepID=UPI000C99E8E6|nr:tetratricopeptide repeat protein [Bowmanella denitrificans]